MPPLLPPPTFAVFFSPIDFLIYFSFYINIRLQFQFSNLLTIIHFLSMLFFHLRVMFYCSRNVSSILGPHCISKVIVPYFLLLLCTGRILLSLCDFLHFSISNLKNPLLTLILLHSARYSFIEWLTVNMTHHTIRDHKSLSKLHYINNSMEDVSARKRQKPSGNT